MSEPKPDAASPEEQDKASDEGSFADSPTAQALCKFALPSLNWAINFKLPNIAFPPDFSLYIPFPAIGINCSLKNPLELTGDIPNGGGRKGRADPDPDE